MLGRNKTTSTGATAVGEAPTTPSAVTTPKKGRASSGHTAPATAASSSRTADSTTTGASTENHPPRPGAKNRPTPKRKDQEAARRRPLVETDRKAAKEADKQRAKDARAEQRAALDRGDEKALPPRDRGPEKRYIRDRVDSRLCIGEVAMPLMLVAMITWFMPNAYVQMIGLSLVWLVVLAGIVDAVIMWRSIKKGLVTKFGAVPKQSTVYAITRAMQMRRLRIPKPQVKRGEKIA